MKTTVNLPKALYRTIRSRSLRERRPIKTILEEIIREAMGQTPQNSHVSSRHSNTDDHRLWREELLE